MCTNELAHGQGFSHCQIRSGTSTLVFSPLILGAVSSLNWVATASWSVTQGVENRRRLKAQIHFLLLTYKVVAKSISDDLV